MNQDKQVSSQQLVSLYRQALKKDLSLDKLEQKISKKIDRLNVSQQVEKKEEQERVQHMRRKLPKPIRYGALVLPVVFILVGIFLLGNAITPIAQYYLASVTDWNKFQLKAPIPNEEVLDVTPLVLAQSESDSAVLGSNSQTTEPIILDTELDYTNLTNWFNDDRSSILKKIHDNTFYTLDIPDLEITNAVVKIGGTNLDENLIAYPGTAFPGELGSPVIFGHSVLRQFYNPSEKNPRRYNSIFSYIMTLEKGDEIFVTHDQARYKYVVIDKSDVKPEDTYILAQQYDAKTLKLVTCVPEGTYLRRGVVTAKLVNN